MTGRRCDEGRGHQGLGLLCSGLLGAGQREGPRGSATMVRYCRPVSPGSQPACRQAGSAGGHRPDLLCFWEPHPHTLRGKECTLAPSPGLSAPGAPAAQPDTPLSLARDSWARRTSWRRRLKPPRGQTRGEAGRRGLWAGAYLQQSRRRGQEGPGGGSGAPGQASLSSCPFLHGWALNPIFTLKFLGPQTKTADPHLQGQ